MKGFITVGILAVAALSMAFMNNVDFESNDKGCGGSGCHAYRPGFAKIRSLSNLKVHISTNAMAANSAISAQLMDRQGRIVDMNVNASQSGISLIAPKPGKYKVNVGYMSDKAYFDSIWIDVKPSLINIPTTRPGTADVRFLPFHPDVAHGNVLLRFSLAESADVVMTLFSLDGRKIDTIYSGKLNSGIHEILWETRDHLGRLLPEGAYLCELSSGQKKVVQHIRVGPSI